MRDSRENESEPLTFFIEGAMDMLPSTFERKLPHYKQTESASEAYRDSTEQEQRTRRMKNTPATPSR